MNIDAMPLDVLAVTVLPLAALAWLCWLAMVGAERRAWSVQQTGSPSTSLEVGTAGRGRGLTLSLGDLGTMCAECAEYGVPDDEELQAEHDRDAHDPAEQCEERCVIHAGRVAR